MERNAKQNSRRGKTKTASPLAFSGHRKSLLYRLDMPVNNQMLVRIPPQLAAHDRIMPIHDSLDGLILVTDEMEPEKEAKLRWILNNDRLQLVSLLDYPHHQDAFDRTMGECEGKTLPKTFS